MNVLSLFSGIGGLELGLERAGMTVVGQVEKEPFCLRVLTKHWPEVPKHDDVRTAVQWWGAEPRPRVDLVCGGFPCQPVSYAGSRLAQDDPRWLWPHMAAVIRGLRPRYVVVENVIGLLTAGLDDVLGDLATLGLDADWGVLSACAVGAPHPRERLFILAHTDSMDWVTTEPRSLPAYTSASQRHARASGRGGPIRHHWTAEPGVGRVVDGLSSGMDRRHKALGNAVVPQVAEHIGRLIMAADRERVS